MNDQQNQRIASVSSAKVNTGSAPRRGRGGLRRVGVLTSVLGTVTALALTACSSSASSRGGSAGGPGSSSNGSSSDGAGGAGASPSAVVAELRNPSNKFLAPGPRLDATSLRGKSLWYVSLGQAIPVLAVEQTGMRQAADALGMTLQICDGKFQPAVAAGCVNSAVSAGAVGVIMDSVTTASVATAITNAARHKVPVLAMSAIGSNSTDLSYGTNGDERAQAVAADWIIADSNGSARVVGTKVQDDTGAIHDIEAGSKPEFAKCSGCTVVAATYTTGTVQNVPSLVSATLLSHRDAAYGFPQFDFIVPLFKAGVQTAGMAGKMKIVSTNAVLSSMQSVKTGGQAVDVGSNRNYSGWLAIDSMLRMLKGMPVPTTWQIPIRVFDKTNIDSIPLDDQAAMTGEWFGPLDYQKDFQRLWGLS
jgi:ribose transport system substrate-binding protein